MLIHTLAIVGITLLTLSGVHAGESGHHGANCGGKVACADAQSTRASGGCPTCGAATAKSPFTGPKGGDVRRNAPARGTPLANAAPAVADDHTGIGPKGGDTRKGHH